jgi:LppX_LprAFG lipoprotein
MQTVNARLLYSKCILMCGFLLLIILVAACGGSDSSSAPPAQQLISQAQDAIRKVTSYHFNLASDHMGTSYSELITIKTADGDLLMPDKLKANAGAVAFGFSVPVQIVAIGGQQYYTDPASGKWVATTGLLDPRSLSDPQTGVAALLGELQNPGKPTDSTVDGNACWSIDGQLATRYLAGITGGGTPAGNTVDTTICIGKSDHRPYMIRVTGIAVQGDVSATTRTFKLSKFNESLSIVAPI